MRPAIQDIEKYQKALTHKAKPSFMVIPRDRISKGSRKKANTTGFVKVLQTASPHQKKKQELES